jgi:hypothetical protein
LAFYRDGAIFTGKFAGENARGRHPNGDEIVQIVDGAATLQIMTAIVHAQGAMVAIVPQGAWHRLEAPDGLSLTVSRGRPSTSPPPFAYSTPPAPTLRLRASRKRSPRRRDQRDARLFKVG